MGKFSELGIPVPVSLLVGEKIAAKKIIGKPITVHGYEVKPSKLEGKGDCVYMAITYMNERRITFTGSTVLKQMLAQVPKQAFPFETIIELENDRYKFT